MGGSRVDGFMRWALAMSVCVAGFAHAHDLAADLSATLTARSANNPRSGALGVGLSGTWEPSDRFSAWGSFGVTRDLATQSGEVKSPGSNIYLLTVGTMWLPTESWSFIATGNWSPTIEQRSALSVAAVDRTTDTILVNTIGSLGAGLSAGYSTAGESNWEHAIDLGVALTRFGTSQKAELPTTVRGNLFRSFCANNPMQGNCPLVNGVTDALLQVRLGATYTAFLFEHFTAGLDSGLYLYDQDPTQAGFYSVVVAGRNVGDLGNGVPILPLLFTAKPFVSWRPGAFSLKLSYQAGVYVNGLGLNHVAGLRLAYRFTPWFKLTAALSAQVDSTPTGLANPGGTLVVTPLFEF